MTRGEQSVFPDDHMAEVISFEDYQAIRVVSQANLPTLRTYQTALAEQLAGQQTQQTATPAHPATVTELAPHIPADRLPESAAEIATSALLLPLAPHLSNAAHRGQIYMAWQNHYALEHGIALAGAAPSCRGTAQYNESTKTYEIQHALDLTTYALNKTLAAFGKLRGRTNS